MQVDEPVRLAFVAGTLLAARPPSQVSEGRPLGPAGPPTLQEPMAADVLWESLRDGRTDLALVPAAMLGDADPEDLVVHGAMTRREPFPVLVGDDRPSHLPRKALIITSTPRLRRQLRRFRADLHTHDPHEWSTRSGRDLPAALAERAVDEPLDLAAEMTLMGWLEQQRVEGGIDGYTLSPEAWRASGASMRRHTLGLHVGTEPERGSNELGARFLPGPFAGLTLIVGRPGFPAAWLDGWEDEGAGWGWRFGSQLHRATPEHLRPYIGAWSEVRRIGALVRQAEASGDQALLEAQLTPEGELRQGGARFVMQAELLGKRGKRTLGLERITLRDDVRRSILRLIQEWSEWIEQGMADQPDDLRLGPARPPFLEG